jgi:ABC-type uncharacterized transport system substrate-binding protein/HAMP domain-containing protein
MYIIGILCLREDTVPEIPVIERALDQLGYAVHLEQMRTDTVSPDPGEYYYEKESVVLWLCRCYGDIGRCTQAAQAFVGAGVDAIIAMTDPALQVALAATEASATPIVFTHITHEPRMEKAIERLRHADRVTGVWDTWLELAQERLSLITEVVPPPTAVHIFCNTELPSVVAEAQALQQASQPLGIRLITHEARSAVEAKEQLAALNAHQDHAILRLADPTFDAVARLMGAVAHEQNIPYIGLVLSELERCNALFAVEARGTGIRAAQMIDRILKGEVPSSISCNRPAEKVVGVNLQAAQDLGLILSPAVMAKANITLPAQETTRLATQFLGVLVLALFAVNILMALMSQLDWPYMHGLAAAMSVALVIWMWLYLNRRVVMPIRELAITAEKIGAGELTSPIADRKASMEINLLARALRRMRSNLKTSYADLAELNEDLRAEVAELTQANRDLELTKQKLELAGRRIVEAEDSGRFALTTFIHDEVYRPLDEIHAIADELKDPGLLKLSHELEQRIRQIRFELSAPILHDIGIELRRLTQETLPSIYPQAREIKTSVDVTCLDHSLPLGSAYTFLIYRFVRGGVSNAYRHSQATEVSVSAAMEHSHVILSVADDGVGFDAEALDRFMEAGHYFFYDIETRARQLNGDLTVSSSPGRGTQLRIMLPLPGHLRRQKSAVMAPRRHTPGRPPLE